MLVDALLGHNILSGVLRNVPVYDLGPLQAFCEANAVRWEDERSSAMNKLPPHDELYAEYNLVESGEGGSDHWSVGVLIRRTEKADALELMRRVSTGTALPVDHTSYFWVDQFERLKGAKRPDDSTRLPLGVLINNLMNWLVCLDGKGANGRILGFIERPAPGAESYPSPYGLDRILSQYPERYFPLAVPWYPFAAFGFLRSGRLAEKPQRGLTRLEPVDHQ